MCEICKSWIASTRDFISENEVIDDIVGGFKWLCESYDLGDVTTECENVVEAYIDALMVDLATFLDPEIGCMSMKMCDSESNVIAVKPKAILSNPYKIFNLKKKSSICQVSLTNVQKKIHQHKADKLVIQALTELCDILHVSSRQCKKFVNSHVSDIFKFIKTSPSVELCDSFQGHISRFNNFSLKPYKSSIEAVTKSPIIIKKFSKLNDMPCTLCTLALTEVQQILRDENWQKLKEKSKQLCHQIPEPFIHMCVDIFAIAFDDISKIVQQFDPNTTCIQIGVCPSPSSFHLQLALSFVMDNVDSIDQMISTVKPFVAKFGEHVL